jgi:SIR2-like protein
MFVGTGFSKAATGGTAPNFEQLLCNVATSLNVSADFDQDPYKRKSLPQVATEILSSYSLAHPPAARAIEQFRLEIAHQCNLVPEAEVGARLTTSIKELAPAWIITTNYDLILESLLEDSESILPNEPLVPRASRVPIFHLHGHRRSPSTIRITEEDYVGLLGPIDYQRLKLPLLLLESSTLMLGYALGDMNVRAAMEWTKSFGGEGGIRLSSWQGRIFQVIRSDSPTDEPREGPNGEIVLEISDIPSFLEELAEQCQTARAGRDRTKESIRTFLANPANALAVFSDPATRTEFLRIVEESLQSCQPASLVDFLSRALDPEWVKAREDGGFEFYDTFLILVLDVLERVDPHRVNPSILAYLGDCVDRVGHWLDEEKRGGTAHAATDTWIVRRQALDDRIIEELRSYGRRDFRVGLLTALSIPK